MASGYTKSQFGGKDQNACTPPNVLRKLESLFNSGRPMFDPCPKDPRSDGLVEEWPAECSTCYVNPPYNNIPAWVEKVLVERKKRKRVVMLIPARCDVNWWHDLILPHASSIHFIRQGIRFVGYKRKCPFPVCVVVFDARDGDAPCYSRLEMGSLDFYSEEKAVKEAYD